MRSILSIKDLSYSYHNDEYIIKNLSLDIIKGEVVVITGPSGCGKSSLTRVINGLIPHFYGGTIKGEVFLNEKPMKNLTTWERGKEIGNVFQDPRSQFFSNEVAGEIAFGCENYGYSHEDICGRVNIAAKDLKIADILHFNLHNLSYGMRQKVAIASAKAIDPKIYVMDEPSANLDTQSTYRLGEMVEKLKQEGKTIVIAEHRLYYLKDIADRFVYMRSGEITEVFTREEMLNLSDDTITKYGLRHTDIRKSCLAVSSFKKQDKPCNLTSFDIEFKNVSFSYGSDAIMAINNLSFVAKQGETTALVGPSGGGKSTVASLVSRFWDISKGCITVGGVDIKEIPLEELMNYVAFVFQDTFLFKQSIKDNISLGKPDATKEEIISAAKAARCHDFIINLPNGYDTVIGTKGIHLSGGEKQRITIARAILKNAPIIVLDEATAFSDPQNEYLIQKAFKSLTQNKTVIMIAHRLATIKNAEHIIVLEQGEKVEQGTHNDLIARNGKYKAMWDSYTESMSWKIEKAMEV